MSQFTIAWKNDEIITSSNIMGVRAVYKAKNFDGDFISEGFDPTNDLSKTVSEVISPELPDNVVYQFKIISICNINGPIDNDNGIKEVLEFKSLPPDITPSINSVTASMYIGETDITKVRYTLRKASDNTVVMPATLATIKDSIASVTKANLQDNTDYYFETELFSNLNGQEVVSSGVNFYKSNYRPFSFKTLPQPVCDPITSLTIKSRELTSWSEIS